MSRKRLITSAAQILGFSALVFGGLYWAAKRPPAFYTHSEMAAGPARTARSAEAVGNFFLIRDRLANFDPNWEVVFTAEQLNAYFQEEFQSHGGDENLPEGFTSPRIQFEDGKMRLGLRYGSGWRSTIISIQVKVWLVPGQTNVLAMEIVSLKAGAMPLSTGSLLDRISQFARRRNYATRVERTIRADSNDV